VSAGPEAKLESEVDPEVGPGAAPALGLAMAPSVGFAGSMRLVGAFAQLAL
jgi:hypothetical protein